MKKTHEIEGKLENIARLKSSINGNPRYKFTIGGAAVCTGVDSSLGYELTNYRDRYVVATVRTHGKQLTAKTIKTK